MFSRKVDWNKSKRISLLSIAILMFILISGYVYQSIMVSILFSIFLTYLLLPFTDWLEKKFRGRRALAVLAVVFGLISLLSILVASLLPVIYQEFLGILKLMPIAFDSFINRIEPFKEWLVKSGLIRLETINATIDEFYVMDQVTNQAKGALEKLWQTTPTLLGGALNLVLVPVQLFFLLKDYRRFKEFISELIPEDLQDSMSFFISKVDKTLKSVLKGQLIIAMTLGGLYMVGLSSVNLKSGLAVGAFSGVCRLVPYLDVILGLSLSLAIVVTEGAGFAQFMAVCMVFVIVQILDGMIITPRVIGERARIHPGIVILSIIAFGDWFGFFGVLIAIPLVSIIMVFLEILIPLYLSSSLYTSSSQDVS
ncbi:MAG: AI-2E family transporter [Oligoflexales bacterium]|nr:AI-2E family transporter [Oligoflexales bacterium]